MLERWEGKREDSAGCVSREFAHDKEGKKREYIQTDARVMMN